MRTRLRLFPILAVASLMLLLGMGVLPGCMAPAGLYSWPAYSVPTPRGTPRETPEEHSSGTCFAVAANGLVATAYHVIKEAKGIKVSFLDGRTLEASVAEATDAADLALLRVDSATPEYLSVSRPRETQQGDSVFTLGFPAVELLGDDPKLTDGVVSALTGPGGEATLLQITVPVQPGNSGGPLVNNSGEVVGVVTSTAALDRFLSETGTLPQNVNWATKSEYLRLLFETPAPRPPTSDRRGAITRTRSAVCRVSAQRAPSGIRLGVAPPQSIEGVWNGVVTNLSVGQSAQAQLALHEVDSQVLGTITIGRPLLGSGELRGAVDRSWFRFRTIGDGVVVDWEGEVVGGRIQGHYVVLNTWPTQRGTWWMER